MTIIMTVFIVKKKVSFIIMNLNETLTIANFVIVMILLYHFDLLINFN